MPRFWRPDLETGIPKLDEQHKELFRQVELLTDKHHVNRLPETLKFLEEYVVKHFGAEEKVMAAIGYPAAARHKKLHADFVHAFLDVKKRFESAEGHQHKAQVIAELNRIALTWLREHIMHQDKDWANYYTQVRQVAPTPVQKKRGFFYRLFHFWQ
jgi:hemerythrin-like metal-binding protein